MIILGDPHLGREFKHGVPVHRRGEREAMQRRDFEASLASAKDQLHVNMGDLFDSFAVPRDVIHYASETYKAAAKANPGGLYVIIMGNHDGRREAGFISSFDLFCDAVEDTKNIVVVRDKAQVLDGNKLFCPWHPFKTAEEIISAAPRGGIDAIFGHWDLDVFGGAVPHNLIPTEFILDNFHSNTEVYTGHVHKREKRMIDGLPVNVVGSMQPYAHGEGDDLYVTIGLDDLLIDPNRFHDKVVRLILKEGETLDNPVDCLQFSFIREKSLSEEEQGQVAIGEFDFEAIWAECLGNNPLATQLRVMYEEAKNAS